ncbi:SRPBCC family protein [Leptobacterium sp. I13]|uniref:SRPBCC family protein n=1 Tax=Leptobacterium meishanense TaxID=3128904 RepID=UPI0030EBDDAC
MEAQVATFNPKDHTKAPLKAKVSGLVKKSVTEVFDQLKDHESMSKWVPMMKKVEMNHDSSASTGACDVGSVRVCQFGKDRLVEKIVAWQPPKLYAYSAEDTADASDHLGVVECEDNGDGTTTVSWSQYFNPKNPVKGFFMGIIMKKVLKKAIKNLNKVA